MQELITIGVNKLKKFGYTNVNEQNILSDEVYKLFFERILIGLLERNKKEADTITQLLDKINLTTANTLNSK